MKNRKEGATHEPGSYWFHQDSKSRITPQAEEAGVSVETYKDFAERMRRPVWDWQETKGESHTVESAGKTNWDERREEKRNAMFAALEAFIDAHPEVTAYGYRALISGVAAQFYIEHKNLYPNPVGYRNRIADSENLLIDHAFEHVRKKI